MRLVLASTSPRRREILALLGLPFEVVHPEFDEVTSDAMTAEDEVLAFSLGKAGSVRHETGSIVIGSDTLIVLDGEKIGKRRDGNDAKRMLSRLSGRRHEVLTGFVIMDPYRRQTVAHVERVQVEMRPFSEPEIEDYLSVGESLDKAGAYSIQGHGGKLIAEIRGDYLAAVGLPLRIVAHHLEDLGLHAPVDVDRLYQCRQFRNWKSIRVLE